MKAARGGLWEGNGLSHCVCWLLLVCLCFVLFVAGQRASCQTVLAELAFEEGEQQQSLFLLSLPGETVVLVLVVAARAVHCQPASWVTQAGVAQQSACSADRRRSGVGLLKAAAHHQTKVGLFGTTAACSSGLGSGCEQQRERGVNRL